MLLALTLTPLATLATAAPAAAGGPTVQVADSVTVVRPTEQPSGALTASADLVAARGEYESFQLVVSAGATPVEIRSVSDDLFGWGTTRAYLEGFYTVANVVGANPQPSDLESDGPDNSWTPHGRWPDPLVPDVDQIYGEKRNAFPFTVTAGEKRAIWVDVFVPYDRASGSYSDRIDVVSDGGTTSIDVSLEVLNWTMPATSSLENVFMVPAEGGRNHVCEAHTGHGACNGDKTKQATLNSLYTRMGLEHRVTQANGFGLAHGQDPTFYASNDWESILEGPLIRGDSTFPAEAKWHLDGPRLTTVSVYAYSAVNGHCGANCGVNWRAEASEAGPGQNWADRLTWYGCDEPRTDVSKWNACKTQLQLADGGWNRPALTTGDWAFWNGTGKATGIPITTLVPYFMELDRPGSGGDNDSKRRLYDDWVAQGKKVWIATACDAAACGDDNSWTYPFGDPQSEPAHEAYHFIGSPSYQVDAPASQSRVMPWQIDKYGLSGELYWATTQKLKTAWNPGGAFYNGANTDGTLFYPGTPAQVGGTKDIPIESIRLKRIRDGREDYEYFVKLRERGYGAQLDEIIEGALPSMYSATWQKDGHGNGSLLQARAQLTELLRTAVAGDPDPHAEPGGPGAPVQTTGSIVYQSDEGGSDYEIYSIKPDGTGKQRLTDNAVFDGFPVWSPNSDRIAWEHDGSVRVMRADGAGTPTTIASGGDARWSKPAWSADGATLYFTRERNGAPPEVHRASADGAGAVEFVTEGFDPATSPDGRLVFSRTHDPDQHTPHIWSVLPGVVPDGVTHGEITYGPVDEAAAVSRDGSRITYSKDGGGTYSVLVREHVVNTFLGPGDTVLAPAGRNAMQSAFSPDDTSLVYASDEGAAFGAHQIWVAADDGSGKRQVTAGEGVKQNPDWGSPTPTTPPQRPPSAPRGVTAAAGDGRATVSWQAPADPGTGTGLSYTVTAARTGDASAASRTCSTTALRCTVTGLYNLNATANPYTFTVVATTSDGTSPASSPSDAIRPTLPSKPPTKPRPKPVKATIGSVKYTGTLRVGKRLTAKASRVKPAKAKIAYQWYRNGKKIPGAKGKTYKLQQKDRGKRIRVTVTVTKKNYVKATKSYSRSTRVKK